MPSCVSFLSAAGILHLPFSVHVRVIAVRKWNALTRVTGSCLVLLYIALTSLKKLFVKSTQPLYHFPVRRSALPSSYATHCEPLNPLQVSHQTSEEIKGAKMSLQARLITGPLLQSLSVPIPVRPTTYSDHSLLESTAKSTTASTTAMCTKVTHKYGCGHELVETAQCADKRAGRCNRVREMVVPHAEKCDRCGG